MHYIYKITNKINNKVYIGQTVNIKKRWSQHTAAARSNKPTQIVHHALIKYGIDNFSFEIIASCFDQNASNEAETIIVSQENSLIPNGYNSTNCGSNAPKTEEWIKNMTGNKNPWYKYFTPEQEQEIIKFYTINQLNQDEIGQLMNCGRAVILRVLKENNIPRIKLKPRSLEKMSKTKTGKPLSEEHKVKLKGRISWMKNKTHSEESKEKNRRAHLGKHHSVATEFAPGHGRRFFSEQEEKEICLSYQTMTSRELSKYYKCSRSILIKIIKKHNITLHNKYFKKQSYNCYAK